LREDDLVIHFRAGDIFVGQDVHPIYGQPPLSYYLSAVEREQPTRVWMLFEDRGNPCVDAMEAALRQRGIEVIIQSASLAGDLRVLLHARRIVSSRGTFVTAIAHLATCLDKIYYFEKGNLRPLIRLGIEVIMAKDEDGAFTAAVLNGQWRNAPEQHLLILSYPAQKLTFERLLR